MSNLFNMYEACKILHLDITTLRALVKNGLIIPKVKSGMYYFTQKMLEEYTNRNKND